MYNIPKVKVTNFMLRLLNLFYSYIPSIFNIIFH